jgi:hypothetical protein
MIDDVGHRQIVGPLEVYAEPEGASRKLILEFLDDFPLHRRGVGSQEQQRDEKETAEGAEMRT